MVLEATALPTAPQPLPPSSYLYSIYVPDSYDMVQIIIAGSREKGIQTQDLIFMGQSYQPLDHHHGPGNMFPIRKHYLQFDRWPLEISGPYNNHLDGTLLRNSWLMTWDTIYLSLSATEWQLILGLPLIDDPKSMEPCYGYVGYLLSWSTK